MKNMALKKKCKICKNVTEHQKGWCIPCLREMFMKHSSNYRLENYGFKKE